VSTNPRPPFEAIGRRCYWSRELLEDVPAAIAAAAGLLVDETAWLSCDQGDFKPPMDNRRFCAILTLMGTAANAMSDSVTAILGELPETTADRSSERDLAPAEEAEP
jgi:hypothetical protein